MKEKIFASLKTACGNNTSVSDKTLEKIAEVLAPTIKEESEIDGLIEQQKPILQAIDGNINFVAAEAVKKIKPEKPPKQPPKPDKPDDPIPEEAPSWFAEWKNTHEKLIGELKSEIEAIKQEKARTALIDKVKGHDKLKNIPASFLKGRNLVPESEDGIDQLVASVESDYTAFKQEMAEQGVVISAPPVGGGGNKEGAAIGKAIAEKKNTNSSDGIKGKAI